MSISFNGELVELVEEFGTSKRVRRFVAVLYNGQHADGLSVDANSSKILHLLGVQSKRNARSGERPSKREVPAHSVKERRSGAK